MPDSVSVNIYNPRDLAASFTQVLEELEAAPDAGAVFIGEGATPRAALLRFTAYVELVGAGGGSLPTQPRADQIRPPRLIAATLRAAVVQAEGGGDPLFIGAGMPEAVLLSFTAYTALAADVAAADERDAANLVARALEEGGESSSADLARAVEAADPALPVWPPPSSIGAPSDES